MMTNTPRNARTAEFRVDRSDWALSSGPGCASRRRRGRTECGSHRAVRRQTLDSLARLRARDRPETELERLRNPALGVDDEAQLAGQSDLSEAGKGATLRARQRLAAVGGRERKSNRQVGAGLVDPDASRHVDEHVGPRQRRAAVAREYRDHHRQAIAVDA